MSTAREAKPELSQVAFDQLIRLLDRQAVVLAELRTRASIVLSAVGIITALMGSTALGGAHHHVGGIAGIVVALVALLVGLHRSIAVLWPVGRGNSPQTHGAKLMARIFKPESRDGLSWQVAMDSKDLGTMQHLESPEARQKIFRTLIDKPEQNYLTIDRRTIAFNEACFALIVQVIGWSAALLFR